MVMTTVREETGEFCVAVAPATRTADSWLKTLAVGDLDLALGAQAARCTR